METRQPAMIGETESYQRREIRRLDMVELRGSGAEAVDRP
jgi:hypothetical protein